MIAHLGWRTLGSNSNAPMTEAAWQLDTDLEDLAKISDRAQ